MADKQPWIVAGERVVCANGHHICTFTQTVYYGDPENFLEVLGDWQQTPPLIGTPAPAIICAQCGAPYYLGNGIFHLAEGWRITSPYPTVRTIR